MSSLSIQLCLAPCHGDQFHENKVDSETCATGVAIAFSSSGIRVSLFPTDGEKETFNIRRDSFHDFIFIHICFCPYNLSHLAQPYPLFQSLQPVGFSMHSWNVFWCATQPSDDSSVTPSKISRCQTLGNLEGQRASRDNSS